MLGKEEEADSIIEQLLRDQVLSVSERFSSLVFFTAWCRIRCFATAAFIPLLSLMWARPITALFVVSFTWLSPMSPMTFVAPRSPHSASSSVMRRDKVWTTTTVIQLNAMRGFSPSSCRTPRWEFQSICSVWFCICSWHFVCGYRASGTSRIFFRVYWLCVFQEALQLLQPLLKDRVDFVRQAAFIALAMVLIQANAAQEPYITTFRAAIFEAVENKFGDTMTKMGAVLAAGILDAGGRNTTIGLLSSAGHKKMASIVGMAVFCQTWFWFPLSHFLSMTFTATSVIGLNKDLQVMIWIFRFPVSRHVCFLRCLKIGCLFPMQSPLFLPTHLWWKRRKKSKSQKLLSLPSPWLPRPITK